MSEQEEALAEMRAQYPYASAEAHMLAGGVLHLRCARCRIRPVPRDWSFVCLCDHCLSEAVQEPRG